MWYTKIKTYRTGATVCVEAESREEAEEILCDWLSTYENHEEYAKVLNNNINHDYRRDYWLGCATDKPFEQSDIVIKKPKKAEDLTNATGSVVDVTVYFFDDPHNTLSMAGGRHYTDVTAEYFLTLINDWNKNYSLKIDKYFNDNANRSRPLICIIATQKPECAKKIDQKIVEV